METESTELEAQEQTEVQTECTNTQTPNTAEHEPEQLAEVVKRVMDECEAKLNAQRLEADKAIKARDEVIAQLVSGNGAATEPQTIVDKINAKRQYKKW